MRRYLVYPMDFDTRAEVLNTKIQEDWEPNVKAQWEANKAGIADRLQYELGPRDFEQKLQDFKDVGSAPFSIVSYHNALFHQARYAFYQGLYFPALTGACALGERMLNHLIIDLREDFRHTPEYKNVFRKDSFSDWGKAIAVLQAWGVFQNDKIADQFQALADLRHRSLHFNPESYGTLREDALAALQYLASIISGQFGFFGGQKWSLVGTQGHNFIGKAHEADPFLKRYYLPQCPLVGPLFAIRFAPDGVLFFDRAEYDGGDVSDEDFAEAFNRRDPELVVSTALPVQAGIVVTKRPH